MSTKLIGESTHIIVTVHAVKQYRARYLRRHRPLRVLIDEIEEKVRQAAAKGDVYNHLPKSFGLYRVRRRQFKPNEFFFLCGQIGFVSEQDARGDLRIISTYSRSGGTPH